MELAWFIVPALALAALACGLGALALWRGAEVEGGPDAPRRDMRVYADQLREIARDRERGLIPEDEAERLRAETARRLLEADRRAQAAPVRSPRGMRGLALAVLLAVPVAAAGVYWQRGWPGIGDLPLSGRYQIAAEARAQRPTQAQMEAEWLASPERPQAPEVDPSYMALIEQLRAALEARPDDPRGLRLLAVNEGNIGNHGAAAAAWIRLIDRQGPETPPDDIAALAESLVMAAGGRVSPEAEVVIERLLERDPENPIGRYYLGLMFVQTGRPDLTFRLWRGLLEDSPSDAPWVPGLRATLPDLAELAGVRYTLPPENAGGRGPSAADVEAAAGMTEEQRQEMIGGMVEGLAARLASSGGPAEDWARLIGALGVLGQSDRARAIWAEARLVFADQPEALALVDAAARAQGLAD